MFKRYSLLSKTTHRVAENQRKFANWHVIWTNHTQGGNNYWAVRKEPKHSWFPRGPYTIFYHMSSLKKGRRFTTLPLVSCEMSFEKRAQEFLHFTFVIPWEKFASTNQKQKQYADLGSVASSVLMVCNWRHGGHVGSQEQNLFPPLGIKLLFHANWRENWYSQIPLYGHPFKTDTSLLRTVCFVSGERKPVHFL